MRTSFGRVDAVHGLVVFELEGALVRGVSIDELLATPLGRFREVRSFARLRSDAELDRARAEMAGWYRDIGRDELVAPLIGAVLAPGACEGMALLRERGVAVAIAAMTWRFAVRYFADQLGVRHYLGSVIEADDGKPSLIGPKDQARWLLELAASFEVASDRVAAVGAGSRAVELLQAAPVRYFVGPQLPDMELTVRHLPGANIATVATRILDDWD